MAVMEVCAADRGSDQFNYSERSPMRVAVYQSPVIPAEGAPAGGLHCHDVHQSGGVHPHRVHIPADD